VAFTLDQSSKRLPVYKKLLLTALWGAKSLLGGRATCALTGSMRISNNGSSDLRKTATASRIHPFTRSAFSTELRTLAGANRLQTHDKLVAAFFKRRAPTRFRARRRVRVSQPLPTKVLAAPGGLQTPPSAANVRRNITSFLATRVTLPTEATRRLIHEWGAGASWLHVLRKTERRATRHDLLS